MKYQRLKKNLVSLMLMLMFALPMATVFESSAFAQGRHLGWYKQQQRQEQRMRRLERERQLRYRYQNNNRVRGYYDRSGRLRVYGYYDRFGRFHPY